MTTPSKQTIPYGTCHCGCGQQTSIAKCSRTSLSHVRGLPVPFICGHRANCAKLDFSDAIPFKIQDVYCKLIPLTKGMYAIVDEADYSWLSKWKWLATKPGERNSFYAGRATRSKDGCQHLVLMHREILGLTESDELEGDHLETGMTLDNRRANLRIATGQQNQHNRRKYKCNKTGYKGVMRSRGSSTYYARIRIDGELIWLGTRPNAKAAHEELYVPAAAKYHGKFARSI